MSITIRKARTEDETSCVKLLAELNEATGSNETIDFGTVFQSLLDESRGCILVAEEEKEEETREPATLLGMASISFNLALRYGGEYCQLEELIVSPAARGKNLGALLVEATLATARKRGCAEYGLYLIPTTEKNRGFYEKFGFQALGTEMRQRL
ncbi:MAG: GNAT family N-acetyltransferase [Pseudomonadota bacterium]